MAKKTIQLKGNGIRNEALANTSGILPGHLIELMSTGKIRVHATAGGSAPERAFAVEDELQGGEIDTAYSSGAIVQYNIFNRGDEVYAWLLNGESVVIGDKLESAGNGELRKVVADTSARTVAVQSIIGIALQAVDMSGSAGVDPTGRIAIRII